MQKRNALHNLLTDDKPVANGLVVEWIGAPSRSHDLSYAVTLDPLSMAEQVAVLQTALFDAGYSFKNIVPAIHRADPPFDMWTARSILEEVALIRAALERVTLAYESLLNKIKHPDLFGAPEPARRTIDPRAIRLPPSLLSSSEVVSGPSQSDAALSSEKYDARVDRRGSTGEDPTPEFQGTSFFQRRGLGWRSDETYDESVNAPSPYRPKPPAFDDPMPDALAYAGVYSHPAARAPAPRRNVMSRGLDAVYASVANPIAAPTFVAPALAPQTHFGVPAQQQHFGAPAPQQPVIVYPRPFVPAGYLEPLTGEEPLEERRQFLTDYKIMAKTAMWSEEEMCQNIYRYVKRPALTFIRQLGKRAKSWRSLEASIMDEYLRSTESPVQRYCSLTQDKNESARHFLWRLNSAADRAEIDLRTPEGVERHVTQFARALRDQAVKAKMSSVVVRSVKELDKMLALHEQRAGSDRSEYRSSERLQNRDKARDNDRDRRDRDRSASRPRQASTYWTYQDDYVGNDYARNAGDVDTDVEDDRTVRFNDKDDYYDAASEDEGRAYRVMGQNMPAQGKSMNTPARWPGAGQPTSSKFRSPVHNRPLTPTQASANTPAYNAGYSNANGLSSQAKGHCFNCGQQGHWAAECPLRQQAAAPTCQWCAGSHLSDSCWKKCPACAQVHAKPEDCVVVRAIEDLKAWYKSPANVTNSPALPPSVLQHLDKPLN